MDFESYALILKDIEQRCGYDWEQMSNNDRAILKAYVKQVINFFTDYAQRIEQWESYYGKVDNVNLQ